MHIETLKVFCDIIESGSVSYAASQNFVTQSAVSQQVRSLEEKYECRLLERARAGVKPTPAGQILYNSSKEIVRRFMELENRLREIGSVVAGSIRVGTVYSVGLHELPPYLTEFLRTYPQVNVHLEYLRSNKIYEDLIEGKIDLGVVAYPAKRSQIVTIAFRYDELVLVVPPDDPLAKLNKVSVSALAGLKFVGYERDIATRKASDRILREHGVKPHYTMEFDNIETIKRAVEIGQGVAIVPLSTVEHETARGSLKMLEFAEGTFTRPLAIIYKRGRELSPAVRKFVEVLTSAKIQSPGTRTEKGDGGNGRSEARAERPDKSERQDRSDRADKGEKPDRAEKAERAERA
ncbi:MAG TPA: LysR substrate-binding domain-containing protein [Candidatus Binataceae bacterium]|nr:LysR substrate-binding domain-containing protein [Candidatus Binataceae bacterium]